MHVVVTGATGIVGSSLVRALSGDAAVDEITAVAMRSPALHLPKVRWIAADVARDHLPPLSRGADAVVHLAWAIQPSHDEPAMRRINVFRWCQSSKGCRSSASTPTTSRRPFAWRSITTCGGPSMGVQVPLMSTARAEAALGWLPRRGALEALAELLEGIGVGAGDSTPPLAPGTGGAMRARELAARVNIRGEANDRR